MATRHLFERPELLDNQTRLILSADVKPRRLLRSAARSVDFAHARERPDSVGSGSPVQNGDNENDDAIAITDRDASPSTRTIAPISEIVDYDTDLEPEMESGQNHSSKSLYLNQCERHGVIPSTHFVRHFHDETLSIPYCGLKSINIKVMIPSLKLNSTITKLDLRGNGLGSRGAVYIAQVLKENEVIDELNLADNDIGLNGCKALCQVLCENRSILKLHLDGNRLNDDCAPLLGDVFSQNRFLTSIHLNRNLFENEATGRLFGQHLAENQALEELSLAWNRLTSKACGYLCKALSNNTHLKRLDLSWNGARLFAAQAIGELLRKNPVIEQIHLENNQLNTECATYIGKGLAKNPSLKVLTLSGNPLESSGCYAVVRPLVKHPASQLRLVDFRGIIVNQDFLDLLTELSGVLPELSVKLGQGREKENE